MRAQAHLSVRPALPVIAASLLLAVLVATVDRLPTRAQPAPTSVATSGTTALLARDNARRLGVGSRGGTTAAPPRQQVQASPSADAASFWAWDFHEHAYYRVSAVRLYRGSAAWVYAEDTAEVSPDVAREYGEFFADTVYPTLRARYGPDPSPGVDADPAVTLLLLDIRDDVYHGAAPHTYYSGYFDPANEHLQSDLARIDPEARSNEREMLYIDIAPTDLAGPIARQTAAHEFAHLVQWAHDPTEAEWLVEGLSELAVYLCGQGHPREHVLAALESPGGSLLKWTGAARDYGRVYLFLLYLHEQSEAIDPTWLWRVVHDPEHGLASVAATLPLGRPLETVLRDFGLALYFDDPRGGTQGIASLSLRADPPPDGYPLPSPPVRDVRRGWRGLVEIEPWAVAGEAFTAGRAGIELSIVPETRLCLGAGRRRSTADVAVETACASASENVEWSFPSDPSGPFPTMLVLANPSELPMSVVLSAHPGASADAARAPSFLPLVARR